MKAENDVLDSSWLGTWGVPLRQMMPPELHALCSVFVESDFDYSIWFFWVFVVPFIFSSFWTDLAYHFFDEQKREGKGDRRRGPPLSLPLDEAFTWAFKMTKSPSNQGRRIEAVLVVKCKRLLRELDARDYVSLSASEIFSVKWGSAVWNYSSGADLWLWMMIMEWGSVLWKIWQEWWHWNHIGIY